MCVTFFGHRDTPFLIQPLLYNTPIDLIKTKSVTQFYVGNHGNFDLMAKNCLKLISNEFPYIKYSLVVAYFPEKQQTYIDYSNSIYPENLETVPRRFAICARNKWLIDQCDIVISYIKYQYGGAAKFYNLAKKKNKYIINLADLI